MIRQSYRLQLATPAFLGDAEQKGVWRTPPLKALIREWWRVAVAAECSYDFNRIKARETALFGTAADDSRDGNQQSRIRLALAHWHEGQCKAWPADEKTITHNEVKNRDGKPVPVGSELYLGFGPLLYDRDNRRSKLKNRAALQADETNTLKVALPDTEQPDLHRALTLAHWFGTVGGRSRNGWGSLLWAATDSTPGLPAISRAALENSGCSRAVRDCLTLDWPNAIGSDSKGVLVWQSRGTFSDWHGAMRFLALTKIGFRTRLPLVGGQPHREPQGRHLLAYPVTHHRVSPWEGPNKGRLANTLRFKLHLEPDGRLRALIYHTPCRPTLPHAGLDRLLLDTWQQVHHFLDAHAELARLA